MSSYLVNEDRARRVEAGHFEQKSDQLLRFATPLAGDDRGADVEERRFALAGDSFGEEGFTGAGRTNQQNASPRTSDALRKELLVSIKPDWRTVSILYKNYFHTTFKSRFQLHGVLRNMKSQVINV